MKFEKLSENKIKITLTSQDLKDKNIDFHSFMSNPLEKQDLFLDILEEAEEEIGFEFKANAYNSPKVSNIAKSLLNKFKDIK